MDFYRLRYFCTVAETQSVHRAAELLRLSPAAISKSLKILEEEVGQKLLLPAGRGITLTENGRVFARRATEILRQLDDLARATREVSKAKRPLRIASFEVFTTHFLGPLLADSLSETPLVLYELGPGKLEEAVAQRTVDLGITYIPIPRAELDFLKVTTLRMGVFCAGTKLQGRELSALPFVVPVLPIEGSPNRIQGLDGWPDHLASRLILHRVTMMESALEIARQGIAAVYLPTFIADLHNAKVTERYRVKQIDVSLPFNKKLSEQPVYLVKTKNSEETATLKKLAAAIRKIVG